ncbi:MAG: hypothetical protein CSB48_08725 [Proteobacteria bacterium]|nr:MAG: hypothetical protein CSB48_08725 [Pseudomonadota bacterium]
MKADTNPGKTDLFNNTELTEKQRRDIRLNLNRDIEAFLSRGGRVQVIDANVRADPPRKPSVNYGSAPI